MPGDFASVDDRYREVGLWDGISRPPAGLGSEKAPGACGVCLDLRSFQGSLLLPYGDI